MRGPFAVIERRDLEIPLVSGLTVEADLYLCAAARRALLVIVLHGLDNSKENHAFQAMHLRDTLHQDVQYPNEHTLRAFEDQPDDTEKRRSLSSAH